MMCQRCLTPCHLPLLQDAKNILSQDRRCGYAHGYLLLFSLFVLILCHFPSHLNESEGDSQRRMRSCSAFAPTLAVLLGEVLICSFQ